MPPPPPLPSQTSAPALLPISSSPPRLILYAQTHHTPAGDPISLLPLITQNTGVTHVILAALHLNEGPGNITLNDHHPDHPRFNTLWSEVRWLQGAGVKVMIMVGGAAKGSWQRLSGGQEEVSSTVPVAVVGEKAVSPEQAGEFHATGPFSEARRKLRLWLYKTFVQPNFRRLVLPFYESFSRAFIAQPSQPDILTPCPQFNAYLQPVLDLIRKHNLAGLDLDIEEEVPLSTPIRVMQRLRTEFGPDFILTLAPTCTALLPHTVPNPSIPLLPYHFSTSTVPPGRFACDYPTLPHLSGFSYPQLMASDAGSLINWLNAQFYCGWGDASQPQWFDAIMASGWPADKVVFGVVTTPRNGSGYVPLGRLREVLRILRAKYPGFGGVMGWEYFNAGDGDSSVGGSEAWRWVKALGEVVRSVDIQPPETMIIPGMAPQQKQLPTPQVQWPSEDVQKLVELGFERPRVVAALNATNGNVELAAGYLFDQ